MIHYSVNYRNPVRLELCDTLKALDLTLGGVGYVIYIQQILQQPMEMAISWKQQVGEALHSSGEICVR